jgi:hypothetical protein
MKHQSSLLPVAKQTGVIEKARTGENTDKEIHNTS